MLEFVEKLRKDRIPHSVYALVELLNNKKIDVYTTVIQKLLYFYLTQKGLKDYYRPYFYGPFSDGVAYTLDALYDAEFLSLSLQAGRVKKYIVNEKKKPPSRALKIIDDVQKDLEGKIINKLREDELCVKSLSLLAKVHWLLKNTNTKGINRILEFGRAFYGWEIKINEFKEAEKRLKELNWL